MHSLHLLFIWKRKLIFVLFYNKRLSILYTQIYCNTLALLSFQNNINLRVNMSVRKALLLCKKKLELDWKLHAIFVHSDMYILKSNFKISRV